MTEFHRRDNCWWPRWVYWWPVQNLFNFPCDAKFTGSSNTNWWPSLTSFTCAAFKKAHATPFVTSQSALMQILGYRQAPFEIALFPWISCFSRKHFALGFKQQAKYAAFFEFFFFSYSIMQGRSSGSGMKIGMQWELLIVQDYEQFVIISARLLLTVHTDQI